MKCLATKTNSESDTSHTWPTPQMVTHPSTNVLFHLFGVLHHFQHCTGHIMTGSWKGRGNQYIQFVRVLYCKLPTNGKQLPAFPLEAMPGSEPRPQRWEARVLPLCHRGPLPTTNVAYCCLTSVMRWILLTICHNS